MGKERKNKMYARLKESFRVWTARVFRRYSSVSTKGGGGLQDLRHILLLIRLGQSNRSLFSAAVGQEGKERGCSKWDPSIT